VAWLGQSVAGLIDVLICLFNSSSFKIKLAYLIQAVAIIFHPAD
jgi:hypothetical protein